MRPVMPKRSGKSRFTSKIRRLWSQVTSDLLLALFVAQGFDRIHAGGFDGGQHAADDADESEDHRGREQSGGVDGEMDVAFGAILYECAPQGKRSHRPGDNVSENYAGDSTEKRDGQGFGEELDQNVPTAGAESFFDADLAGALSDGDQHDVHQAYAADAEREQADEPEQDFDAGGDDSKVKQIGKHVEDKDGALILGVEIVVKGHRAAHRVGDFQGVAFVFHGDSVEVISVGEVVHGAKRDVHFAVHVFVAIDRKSTRLNSSHLGI